MRIFKFIAITISLFLLLLCGLASYILVDFSPENTNKTSNFKSANIVNDVTQLNPIEVSKIIRPNTLADIVEAIKNSHGPISIGGGRYSQGGQTAFPNSLHLDMRAYNKVVSFEPEKKVITVESGITWRDLQEIVDPSNLSIKIMQTYSNFTVGGSLSVNVHGRYIGEGPIIRSVVSMKIVLANGDVVTASPCMNESLYYGVIGGYGGVAVIAEVTLQLTDNVKVKRYVKRMKLDDYSEFFKSNIRNDPSVIFHNADLYPPTYSDVSSVSWLKTEDELTETLRLIPKDREYSWQPKVAEFVAESGFGKWLRRAILEPALYSFDAVEWRNFEASYSVAELEPKSRKTYTYALREYFIPIDNFETFAVKMRDIFNEYKVNVINVSIRHALPDNGSLLAWAPKEVFAFVIYYRQEVSEEAQKQVEIWSQQMVNAVIEQGGAYYLPYQLHATTEQFEKAYPRAGEFYALKNKYDPDFRFRNKLWEQHFPEKSAIEP